VTVSTLNRNNAPRQKPGDASTLTHPSAHSSLYKTRQTFAEIQHSIQHAIIQSTQQSSGGTRNTRDTMTPGETSSPEGQRPRQPGAAHSMQLSKNRHSGERILLRIAGPLR